MVFYGTKNNTADSAAIMKRWLEQFPLQPDSAVLVITTDGEITTHHLPLDTTNTILLNLGQPVASDPASTAEQTIVSGEHMPFADRSFDVIVSRFVTSGLPDSFRFVLECARMLKSGGILLVEDQLRPDDPRDGTFVDAFERLRNPAHQRTYAGYEWRGLLLDAGLTVVADESIVKPASGLIPWAEALNCPPEIVTRLQIMLAQAPPAVATWLQPKYTCTADAVFCPHHIIIMGRKEG